MTDINPSEGQQPQRQQTFTSPNTNAPTSATRITCAIDSPALCRQTSGCTWTGIPQTHVGSCHSSEYSFTIDRVQSR